jgi:hypothetical protein
MRMTHDQIDQLTLQALLSAAETTMLVSMTSRSGIMPASVFGRARL